MSYLSVFSFGRWSRGWLAVLIEPKLTNSQMRGKYSRKADDGKRFCPGLPGRSHGGAPAPENLYLNPGLGTACCDTPATSAAWRPYPRSVEP